MCGEYMGAVLICGYEISFRVKYGTFLIGCTLKTENTKVIHLYFLNSEVFAVCPAALCVFEGKVGRLVFTVRTK